MVVGLNSLAAEVSVCLSGLVFGMLASWWVVLVVDGRVLASLVFDDDAGAMFTTIAFPAELAPTSTTNKATVLTSQAAQ